MPPPRRPGVDQAGPWLSACGQHSAPVLTKEFVSPERQESAPNSLINWQVRRVRRGTSRCRVWLGKGRRCDPRRGAGPGAVVVPGPVPVRIYRPSGVGRRRRASSIRPAPTIRRAPPPATSGAVAGPVIGSPPVPPPPTVPPPPAAARRGLAAGCRHAYGDHLGHADQRRVLLGDDHAVAQGAGCLRRDGDAVRAAVAARQVGGHLPPRPALELLSSMSSRRRA